MIQNWRTNERPSAAPPVNLGGGGEVTETLEEADGFGTVTDDCVVTAELLLAVETDVDADAEVVDFPGTMTLSETVAPHFSRGVPLGQQPALVQ